jgi:hypothetical protein
MYKKLFGIELQALRKEFKYLCYIYIIFFEASCANLESSPTFIPLSTLNKTDTIEAGDTLILDKKIVTKYQKNLMLHRTEYFLVKGDTLEITEETIDSFINMNKPVGFERFDSYDAIFIKESPDINEKKIPPSDKVFETDGFSVHKDFIYNYSWSKGAFRGKLKFQNGKLIYAKKEM